MKRDLMHVLVGYDPESEQLAYKRPIPASQLKAILRLVTLDADDPEARAAYPIPYPIVADICGMIQEPRPDRRFDYFLESRSPSPKASRDPASHERRPG